MTYHEDPDLERRLRRISDSPEPPVPASAFEYAEQVTREVGGNRVQSRFGFIRSFGARGVLGGLATAAVLVAIVATGLLISASRGGTGASSPSASPSTSAGPSESVSFGSPSPIPTVGPSVSLPNSGPRIETTGVAADWKGFAPGAGAEMDNPTRVFRWSGGYVATQEGNEFGQTTPTKDMWVSSDGQTWRASSVADDFYVSAAPNGLIAIAVTSGGGAAFATTNDVWTSADGTSWHDAGAPNLPGTIVSVAGTDKAIIATVRIAGTGAKGSNDSFKILTSTDGISWTDLHVNTAVDNLTDGGFGFPPHVQSNGGRFYLMATESPAASTTGFVLVSSTTPPDDIWLSDDGKSWTRSAGGYSMDAAYIDFASGGMVLHTSSMGIPGGTGLAYSTDNGVTWHDEPNLAPLGSEVCTGACSSGPDGVVGSNGTTLVAVKNGGKTAWVSVDGKTWTKVTWPGNDPAAGDGPSFCVLPRGVHIGAVYLPAK